MQSRTSEALRNQCSEKPVEKRTRSWTQPIGLTARDQPPKSIGPVAETAVFVIFVVITAYKLIAVGASKSLDLETGKKIFLYQTSSVIVLMSGLLLVGSFGLCFAVGGKAQVASVFQMKPLLIFSLNGAAYAVGDYLQMASLSSLHGAAFQILVQSRIIITAGLLICAKGVNQTRLQWILLCTLTLSVSAYMIIMSGAKNQADSGGIPIAGVIFVFSKVSVSCVCNVVSDKYMKIYKDDPTHVQIARMSMARSVVVVLLSFTGDMWTVGFFSGWDWKTFGAESGFLTKEVATYYIVALLDSNLRNIGEAVSIPVIYAYEVLAVGKAFDVASCLAVVIVVATSVAYIDSKVVIDKAAKYDQTQTH